MKVSISDNGEVIADGLNFHAKKIDDDLYRELQKYVSDSVTIMKLQINRGQNVEGARHRKGYSPAYKEKRRKAGYQTAPVNLTITGGMRSALTSSIKRVANRILAEIFFTNTATTPPRGFGRKATTAVTKARGVEAHGYKFFGLSKRRINELFNIFR